MITRDRKTANLAFGVRLQSLADQKRIVESIEERLDPPAGVTADVVGLPALAAEANSQLSSPLRRALHAAGGAGGGVPRALRRAP